MPYSIAVSKLRPVPYGTGLRRPFLSDFFIAVRLLKRPENFTEPSFALLARAFNRAGALHPFYLTAWVFLPNASADGQGLCAPVCPVTISLALKSVKRSSMSAVNQRRWLAHPGRGRPWSRLVKNRTMCHCRRVCSIRGERPISEFLWRQSEIPRAVYRQRRGRGSSPAERDQNESPRRLQKRFPASY